MKKHLSVRYGTIQGCYWMGYAALMGYASVYLLEKTSQTHKSAF